MRKTASLPVKILSIALPLTLVGCTTSPDAPPRPLPSTPSASASDTPSVLSLRDFDLGNADWKLDEGHGNRSGTIVKLKDGKSVGKAADKLSPQYTLGDVIYSDLNADGVEDAAATLEYSDGNAYANFMYLWLADARKPK